MRNLSCVSVLLFTLCIFAISESTLSRGIDLKDGQEVWDKPLLFIAEGVDPLVLVYSTQRVGIDGIMGRGWAHSLDYRLFRKSPTEVVVSIMTSGNLRFKKEECGWKCASSAVKRAELEENPDGTWRMSFGYGDGSVNLFNFDSDGTITSIESGGKTIQFVNVNGFPIGANVNGVGLQFLYTPEGKVGP